MSTKRRYFSILFILLMVLSCENENFENKLLLNEQDNKVEDVNYLKSKFSYALARVLSESKEAREFIKREALKQFDYDYDVLYVLVKDKYIDNTVTLEKLLLHFISKEEIEDLLIKIPTLTIFVPSLPLNSFSAELWNVDYDIPCVAYKDKNGKILFVNNKGDIDDTLDSDEIPLFPVVVLKPSERIVLQSTLTRGVSDLDLLRADNGTCFAFEYPEFNNVYLAKTRANSSNNIPEEMQKLFDAKKYADSEDIWQRDYIYYNILTKNGSGTLCRNISECLYAFQLNGNTDNIYHLVSDQGDDPYYGKYSSDRSDKKYCGWYGGNYEFIVKIYVSNDQLISNEIIKALSISPTDLFTLRVDRSNRSLRILGVDSLIKYYLPVPLPLFDWDIEHYSTSVKISIEERDENVTEQNVIETTTTFATNFGFDINFGEIVKKGAKFGASVTKERKVSTTITRTLGSDELGDVVVNFGDDIIVKNEMELVGVRTGSTRPDGSRVERPIYRPALNPKYNSGYYKLEIVPLAMY
ncbi:hypothetical protein [uncultured Bacteroides sp.]|uniref:hypothetical protein n=1 Tax=uncultured Bacteroides sp. TaxID=162156 RepID=UPI0025D77E3F|nr:hypothetical protein [uncultured Bacteroides sp.]